MTRVIYFKCALPLHNCRVHLLSVIELSMAGFGSFWAYIMSVVIHAGLDQTCKAYANAIPLIKDNPYV